MTLNFEDPTTWDEPMTPADAIGLGIWALNTLQHPDASTDSQFSVADFFTEGAVELLAELRDKEQWVVETIYNTDPDGKWVDEDDYSNRTLHGPFTEAGAQKFLEEFLADDTDVKDMTTFPLNKPTLD